MEQDSAATSAPKEIQQNQLELTFWQLRSLFNESKRVGYGPAEDIQIATLVAQITEQTKASGLVYFSQHENLFHSKSADLMTLIHETWSLLERQVKKTEQCLTKVQIVSCLQFMKSICTIQQNTAKNNSKVIPSQKDRINLIWLAMEHTSIEILCHLYSFFLEYKAINKSFQVNSKTTVLAKHVSGLVFERLLKDSNSELSDENHLIHYGKFKFECKAGEIAGQDLFKIVKEVLFKVIDKKADLTQEETGFKQELVTGLFYILSVRTAEDYNFAFQIFLAHSQSDQAMQIQMKESKVLQKIITMLFQTKDKALVLSILKHPQMSKPAVAFHGCERGAEEEFQFQNALLFRIAKQLCSIRITQEKQADVEMSAFDDQEPELNLVQVVNEEPFQREVILDSQVQHVIAGQINDFLSLRIGRSMDAERLEIFKNMIRNLLRQSIKNPLEQNGVIILNLFIYANLRYSVMTQQSWLLDAQHPQNLSIYIEYVKELFRMLDLKIIHQEGGKQVEVSRNYKTKLIVDVMERLHFLQTSDDEAILVFGQRLTDSQLIQSMLPMVLARNGDGKFQEQNDCLFLALIRLITKILDNAPNLISQYLNHGEENSVIKSIMTSLSKRLPQAQTHDKDTLSVLIDFQSIILRVADGKEYLKNSELIKLAVQDKLNPMRQFFLGDLVYPQSNVSAQAVLQFQKDSPKTFQVINEHFNQSIIQLESAAKKLFQIYITEMQNSASEPQAIQLLKSDAASHNFRVRSLFIISITDAFNNLDMRSSQKLIQIFLQVQNFRKIMSMFNTIALLPPQFTNETRVLDLIRPMVNDEHLAGGVSATTVFIENVKASIMDLNSYTNTTLGQLNSIDDLTSESNVSTTSQCITGILRSNLQGRKLELKLRLRLVLHFTNTIKNLSEKIFKRIGSYDFSTEITVLSQLFQLFDMRYYQVLNEIFVEQTPLSKSICSRYANKLEELKKTISYDIDKQKKWNDKLSVIGNSAANKIKEEYGDASEDRYLLKFLIETSTTENFSHAVAISDQETMKKNLRSIGEMCASFAKKLKLLSSADGLDAVHYNASLLESLNFVFVMELKMVNGSLLMAFWKHGGIAHLCKFYLNMVELQESVLNAQQDTTDFAKALLRLSVLKQREIVALILTNLLNCPKDIKSNFALTSYKKINYETECGPDFKLLSMKHFFFNFYNQFLQNLQADLLQQRGQIQDTVFETLTELLADQFSTIIDAASLERLPRERERENIQILGGRLHRLPQNEAAQAERDPAAEDITILESMGYDSYLAGPALRMAGHQLNRAVELLMGPQNVILAFIDQRSAQKEAEQKLVEAQELAMAMKMSEGDIDDEVEDVKIISIEEFLAIVKEKIPALFKTLLQANDSTLITSTKAINLVKKLALQLKEDSFEMWDQLQKSFTIMVTQLQSEKEPLLLSKLQQHLEVYVNLLSKMKPSLEKALVLSDIKAAGTALLQCLNSQNAQQCLYLLQGILYVLQNIPDYFNTELFQESTTTNDYLLQVLKSHEVIRPTLDLTLIIACKRTGLVKESSERQMLAYQYICTLRKQPVGSRATDALATYLTYYSVFGDQQVDQICDKLMKGSFVTVAKLREAVLTDNKKQVPRIENGELSTVLTKYKLSDMLEQLQKVTSNEQSLLAKINEKCQVIERNGEYTVQFQQSLFSQAQNDDKTDFDELIKNKDQFKVVVDTAYFNQLKFASNQQISTLEEILGFVKETVDFRLNKISQFEKDKKDVFKNQNEQNRASSQASDSLLNIFGCVADLIQLTPNLIVVFHELVKEKPFAIWLVDDFFPSVAVNFEKLNDCFFLECKSLKIEAIMRSLTCVLSMKNEDEKVLAHDLRSRILIAATNSLKINKSCHDNLSKVRVIAALAVVRSCIQMKGSSNQMLESNCLYSTLEMLSTTFIADLQECFAGETQQFNLNVDPQNNLRNKMIELAIECLQGLCQKVETWKTRKYQAKKVLQVQPAVVDQVLVNQIAVQAEQMQQDINIIVHQMDQQQVPELIQRNPDQQDDESSSEMDEDAPEEDDQSDEYGEHDHDPEEDESIGGDEIDGEQEDQQQDPVPDMALDFDLGMGRDGDSDDSAEEQEAMFGLMRAAAGNELQLQVGGNRIPVSQIDNLGQQAQELLNLLSGTDRQAENSVQPAKLNIDSIFDCIKPPTDQKFTSLHILIQKAFLEYQRKNSKVTQRQITFIETRAVNSSSADTEEHFMMQMMRRGRLQDMPHELAERYMAISMNEMRAAVRAGAPLNAVMGPLHNIFGDVSRLVGPPQQFNLNAPQFNPFQGGQDLFNQRIVRDEEEDDIRAEFVQPVQMDLQFQEDQRRQNQSLAVNIIATLNQRGLISRLPVQDSELSNEEMKSQQEDVQMEARLSPEVSPRQSQQIQSPLIVQGNALLLQPQPENIAAQAENEVVQLQLQQPIAEPVAAVEPIVEPVPVVEPMAEPVPVVQPVAEPVPLVEPVAEQLLIAEPVPIEPIVAEEIKEEEPMTFGVPNSVLIAHNIDPSVLEFLPEEMRIELMSSIQWQPAAVNNIANANNDPNEVDQEFMLALPESIRQELEADRARNRLQQAQPMVEDSLAAFIATIIDPRVRAETLIGLTPEQVATLPPGLRAEAVAANQRHAEHRAREQQRIEEMMRQQQRQLRGPNAAGPRQGHLFGMRDPNDEIDEIQARHLQDREKLIELDFKSNSEKLITPNQAYFLLEKVRPYVIAEQITELVGSQVEIQIAANQSTVQSILTLLFKTTIAEEKVDDVVARFCGRLIPLLSSMMQIKSANNYLNRIKITNCLTVLVSQQLAEDSSLFQALVNQSQDHDMEPKLQTKAPIVIFIVVKLLSQMNRHFVIHLLQQFLFKDCDFAKNSLQICLPVQSKKPDSPLLVEILSYLNLKKGKKTDPTVHTVLHHIMSLVFGNFDLVIDDVLGSHKTQIGTAQIEIIIEALKLQATSKKLLASFANVLIHIAGINTELWEAINKKCHQDAVNVLSYINQTFQAIDSAFGNYKPQSLSRTESEMLQELTLQRNESQTSELHLIKTKSLMKGEEQSLQQMLKESGDALCVLRNFLCLLQNMTPAENNKDERSLLLKSTQLKFSESKEQFTYLQQLSEVLQIVQATKSDQNLMVHLIPNIICAFELYLPEIIASRKNQEGDASGVESGDKSAVKMLPVTPGEQTSNNIFGILGSISDRLKHFGRFCMQNKRTINKLISAKNTDPELNKLVTQVPSIVDFENKKAYFKREMTKLNQENRQHQIRLSIKRPEIFHDAYRQLNHLSAKELRGRLSVSFAGEQGIDAGGVSRDFFANLSKSMFKVEYSLFKKADNGVSYCCNEQSDINPDHLAFFKFIGRMVGKAVCDKQLLDCYFTKSVYKCMLGQALCFDDLFDQDNQMFTSLKWIIDNNPNYLELDFTADQQFFGRSEKKNLIPNGASVVVTEENKHLYVEKHAFFKMYTQVKNQMDAFLKGFHELMPLNLIQIFSHKELEMLISGLPNFDLDDLKKNTDFQGYNANSQVVIWLFEILQDFTKEQIGLFLMFVTGSSKIPMEGFCALQGNGGPKRFEIIRNPTKNLGKLPSSHTCFNQIELPEYPSKEVLYSKLEMAITGCSEIDNV